MSKRQSNELPLEPKPNPKREDVNVVMTRRKRIQEDSEETENSFPKVTDDVLTEKDQAPKKVEVPTDGI